MKKITDKKLDLDTISGVACYILLVIYKSQIINIESIEFLQIDFESGPFVGKQISDVYNNKQELSMKLLSITENVSVLINAFRYLKDKDFLRYEERKTLNQGYSFYNFYLTSKGVDVIEDAKNNPLRSKEFAKTFNLDLSLNLDSFVKANNIVGVGGAASVE